MIGEGDAVELAVNGALIVMLVMTALAIARLRGLFTVAMLSGIFSLISACLFVQMDAVDVAFTEAAVGAGISTVLFLGAFALTSPREKPISRAQAGWGLVPTVAMGAALVWASLDMPYYGSAAAPVQTHPMTERFLVDSREEIGIPNAVTSVLASYRGYDTLGEVTVIFTAGLAVVLLIWGGVGRRADRPRERPE